MSQPNVSVLMVSFDGYAKVWKPLFDCFFRFWPDCPYPVYLGSNEKQYPDARVKPLLYGKDVDYSSNLIKMVQQLDTDWVIVWMDDFLPTEKVDTARIDKIRMLAERENGAYVNLTVLPHELTPLFTGKEVEGEIGEMRVGAPYRIVLGVSLWRREALLRVLKPGETAWQIEREGGRRTNDTPWTYYFVARSRLRQPPIHILNSIEEGRWTRRAVRFLNKAGFGDALAGRAVELLRRSLVVGLYCRVRYYAVRVAVAIGGERAMRLLTRLISSRAFVLQN